MDDSTHDDDAATIVDDEEWTEGDFTIISSDNVRFRIQSYHLFSSRYVAVRCSHSSHSGVFRDMAADDANMDRLVHLTDTGYETAAVLRRFFALITSSKLEIKLETTSTAKALNLARFLLKFDCPGSIETLKLLYRKFVLKPGSPSAIHGFILGAVLDDVDLCVDCLEVEKGREASWSGANDQEASDALKFRPNALAFNPAALPLNLFISLPGPYLWALCRAWDMVGKEADLPVKFKELITAAKGWSRPPPYPRLLVA